MKLENGEYTLRPFPPEKDLFVNICGIVIDSLGNGVAAGHCVIEQKHLNPWGIAHGGATFTLLDTIAGTAVRTIIPKDKGIVTLSSNIYFMKPVSPGKVIAEGKVIKPGQTITIAEACLYDENGKMAAKASFEFFTVQK